MNHNNVEVQIVKMVTMSNLGEAEKIGNVLYWNAYTSDAARGRNNTVMLGCLCQPMRT